MVIFSHVGINIPYIRVNLITTETCSPEPWKSWFILGESSQMAQDFRLVNHNSPRSMLSKSHFPRSQDFRLLHGLRREKDTASAPFEG